MDKKELIKKLDEVSGELENFLSDSSLATAVKDFKQIQGRLDEIINEIQEEEDEEETDKEELDEPIA